MGAGRTAQAVINRDPIAGGRVWRTAMQNVRAWGRAVDRAQQTGLIGLPGIRMAVYLMLQSVEYTRAKPRLAYSTAQVRHTLNLGSDKDVWVGVKQLESAGLVRYLRAVPEDPAKPGSGRLPRVELLVDGADIDAVPPDDAEYVAIDELLARIKRAFLLVCRGDLAGKKAALTILASFITEAVTWARPTYEVSDAELGLKPDVARAGRIRLTAVGIESITGSGRTATRYLTDCGQGAPAPPSSNESRDYIEKNSPPVDDECPGNDAADAAPIATHELVDHIAANFRVPITRQMVEYASQLAAGGISHAAFNRCCRDIERERGRPERINIGLVHSWLESMIERAETGLLASDEPRPETAREHAERKFFEVHRAIVTNMSEDELNDLRRWAHRHWANEHQRQAMLFRGLSDPYFVAVAGEALAARHGYSMSEWIELFSTEHLSDRSWLTGVV